MKTTNAVKKPTPLAWRDRAEKQLANARCCWVCGRPGGDGFSVALRFAGYRVGPQQNGYAHPDCMQRAQREHERHVRHEAHWSARQTVKRGEDSHKIVRRS